MTERDRGFREEPSEGYLAHRQGRDDPGPTPASALADPAHPADVGVALNCPHDFAGGASLHCVYCGRSQASIGELALSVLMSRTIVVEDDDGEA